MNLTPGSTYDFVTDSRKKTGGLLAHRLSYSCARWTGVGRPSGGGCATCLWIVGIDEQNRRVSIPVARILEIQAVK